MLIRTYSAPTAKDIAYVTSLVNEKNLISVHETGSSYICDPPVLDTDWDYLLLVEYIDNAHADLLYRGFDYTSLEYEEMPGEHFRTYRKDQYNLIVTTSTQWYVRFCAATEYCKTKNVLNKETRIMFFNLILQDKEPNEKPISKGTSIPADPAGWPGIKAWYGSTAPKVTSYGTGYTITYDEVTDKEKT